MLKIFNKNQEKWRHVWKIHSWCMFYLQCVAIIYATHSYSCSNVQRFTSTQAAIRNSGIKFPWDLPPDAEKKAGRARVGQFLGSKGLNIAVWFKKSWFLYDFSLWPCRGLRVCILVFWSFWSVLVRHLSSILWIFYPQPSHPAKVSLG